MVHVLGGLEVSVDGCPIDVRGGLRRRLLIALVAAGERPTSTDALAEALWGETHRRRDVANAVQAHVSRLRRLLDPTGGRSAEWLESRPDGYVLHPDHLDLLELEARLSAAEGDATASPAAALAALGELLEQWADPVDEDLPAWDPLLRHWVLRRLGAEDLWADLASGYGRGDCADRILELARRDPVREVRWSLAMRALVHAGRQAEALAAFAEARRVLADEYGLEPGHELLLTQEAVLRQDPELLRPPVAATGLAVARSLPRPVSSFVGREAELARLERLGLRSRVVTLTGPGGIGKSRLLAEWVHRTGRVHGTQWVDLRDVVEAGVVGRIGAELGLLPSESGDDHLIEVFVAAASGLPQVLVLDNVDEVADRVAALVATLVWRLPQLTVMVTSRRPLGLSGERVLPVPALRLDPVGGSGGDALALAAARLDPGAGEAHVRDVAERSGGVPLAIELLAARSSAGVLGAALPSDLTPLDGIVATVVEELAPDARDLFAALLALPAGAPPALTAALAASAAASAPRAARLVTELVGSSLLATTPTPAPSGEASVRYRVLQPVVDLVAPTLDPLVQDTALARVTTWLVDHCPGQPTEQPNRRRLSVLLGEGTTVDTVLRRWEDRSPGRLLDAALRLGPFWVWSGQGVVSRSWLIRALDAADADPATRAWAIVQQSQGQGLGHMAAEVARLDEAVALLASAGIDEGPLWGAAHGQRAVGRGWTGDLTAFEADLALARAARPRGEAEWFHLHLDLLDALGEVLRGRGPAGVDLARAGSRAFEELDDPDNALVGIHYGLLLAALSGRDDAVPGLLGDGERLMVSAQPHVCALFAVDRATRALRTGSSAAVPALVDAIRLTERTGNLRTAATGRRDLGLLHLRAGRREAAHHELDLAAGRLLALDRAAGSLAFAGLSALARGRRRADLAEVAWSLALGPGGSGMSADERAELERLTGGRPEGVLDVGVAADLAAELLGRPAGHAQSS